MSVVISKKHKYIFIHVPKTGGTSIYLTLKKNTDDAKLIEGHHRLVNILYKENFNFADYYKFGIVRNPWDRVVSLYSHFNQIEQVHRGLSNISQKDQQVLQYINNVWDFSHFCECLKKFQFHALFLDQAHWLVDNNFWLQKYNGFCNKLHLNTFRLSEQHIQKKQLMVDFIGRYENLEEDFYYISQKLKIPNSKLPHYRKTQRCEYKTIYTQKTAKLVGKFYQRDIQLFGYKF